MGKVVLTEPATYIYAGDDQGGVGLQEFAIYWTIFSHFRDFIEFNELRFACSPDLQAASRDMFPWTALPPNTRHERRTIQDLATQVVRFLANYAVNREYAGLEDEIQIQGDLLRNGVVYVNVDIWLAWHDLLGQVGSELAAAKREEEILLACETARSCVPADRLRLELLVGRGPKRVSLGVCRLGRGPLPSGTIDPRPFKDMCQRRPSTPVDIDWEDTGHLPPAVLQRVLVRTAREASKIVLRMNTTRWMGAVAACKVEPAPDCRQLQFRVSEGDGTLIGMFTTVAQNQAEQIAAHTFVDRIFQAQCTSAGLHYA